mmetsp:Transcript_29708/g.78862  ORF Transcript_29708/g.78862 Transcript_29708/m.78862 type:complete len:81 (+) Transcript_29708:2350-2592(+)
MKCWVIVTLKTSTGTWARQAGADVLMSALVCQTTTGTRTRHAGAKVRVVLKTSTGTWSHYWTLMLGVTLNPVRSPPITRR